MLKNKGFLINYFIFSHFFSVLFLLFTLYYILIMTNKNIKLYKTDNKLGFELLV